MIYGSESNINILSHSCRVYDECGVGIGLYEAVDVVVDFKKRGFIKWENYYKNTNLDYDDICYYWGYNRVG